MATFNITPNQNPLNKEQAIIDIAKESVKIINTNLVEKVINNTTSTLTPPSQNTLDSISEANLNKNLSLFGLPVWDTTTITYQTNGVVQQSYLFSIASVIITQNRNIVMTNVQGMDGAIFEYVSDKSYMINIDADIISGEQDVRPDSDINQIIKLCNVKAPLNITNTMLNNNFGINQIIIEDYSISQQEQGNRTWYKITMQCWSDNPALYQVFLNV